jgi:Ras-related protein Rab-1A
MSSIGVDFKSKQIELDDKLIKLQIWDTAGHEKFRTITTSYYKSAHAIIILYDITEQSSFEHIKTWMVEIDKFAKQGVLKIMAGNKKDLEDKRQVTKEEGQELADAYGLLFFETSAKTDVNVKTVFNNSLEEIARRINSNYYDLEDESCGIKLSNESKNQILKAPKKEKHKKKSCC